MVSKGLPVGYCIPWENPCSATGYLPPILALISRVLPRHNANNSINPVVASLIGLTTLMIKRALENLGAVNSFIYIHSFILTWVLHLITYTIALIQL